MEAIVASLEFENSLIITAPPGWGKTFKLLEALKVTRRKALFVFPLRALCDEVFILATKKHINVCNIRSVKEFRELELGLFDLIISTPECLHSDKIEQLQEDHLFILDECHLFYYWGESFRQRMMEVYEELISYGAPLILLSATVNSELMEKFKFQLKFNYKNIYLMNVGNQELKNLPTVIYYYPFSLKAWLNDDFKFSKKNGVSLIFCKYRSQVSEVTIHLRGNGYKVLSCVGGESREFIDKLYTQELPDFIVATSVISHGVNLPNVEKVYFLYKVENLDFYIQMIGRGGRDGSGFELHTFNRNYFSNSLILKGFIFVLCKRISNRLNSFLYWINAC